MSIFKRIVFSVLDCFLPSICCICETNSETSLCDSCLSTIPFSPEQFELEGFASVHTFTPYLENTIQIIGALKYGKLKEISKPVGAWIAAHFEPDLLRSTDFIIPVPLHKKRHQEREFNQSVLLFQVVADQHDIPIIDGVRRTKNTQALHQLSIIERKEELLASFQINPDIIHLIKDRQVMIVDDIATTGATFKEIASVLAPYTSKIVCVAFSRTPINS